MSSETKVAPGDLEGEASGHEQMTEHRSPWDAYWDRFRRQQVDDPVPERLQGIRERFECQRVDDPVDQRRSRRMTPAHS
jgi:hypothetical protein